jgi:transcriptional regulator with XRE-family HTH domain
MPRVEKELSCANGFAVTAFAAELRRVRAGTGLPYRTLAQRAHYSHSSLVRAARGDNLPTWEVAKAFLGACGIPAGHLPQWQRLWTVAVQLTRTAQLGLQVELAVCLDQVRALAVSPDVLSQGATA